MALSPVKIDTKSMVTHVVAVAVAVGGILTTLSAVLPGLNVPAPDVAYVTAASAVVAAIIHAGTGILNPAGPGKVTVDPTVAAATPLAKQVTSTDASTQVVSPVPPVTGSAGSASITTPPAP